MPHPAWWRWCEVQNPRSRLHWRFRDDWTRCQLCNTRFDDQPKRHLGYDSYVDHDHKTRWCRGLVCRSCNVRLGLWDMQGKALSGAREYVWHAREWSLLRMLSDARDAEPVGAV